jgi:hypothetical protein
MLSEAKHLALPAQDDSEGLRMTGGGLFFYE